jgi:hypothetical protein
MTDGRAFALGWGVFAVVFGLCYFRFRHQISRVQASLPRLMRRQQSPTSLGAAGIVMAVVGVAVFVGGLTGVLR